MKRIVKISLPLVIIPFVFSCAANTNNDRAGIASAKNEQCTIDVYCQNCYVGSGDDVDNLTWHEKLSMTVTTDEQTELYFNAKSGYNLPSNVYSIREKESGAAISEYTFKNDSNYKKLIFVPTSSTIIELVADNDCVEIKWDTTKSNENVGFSYNGGINFVDWGDGTVDSLSQHTYIAKGSYTAKISGNINSIAVGTNNPSASNLYYDGNQDIKEINIKNSVSSIHTGAFSNLPKLEKISIPESVTEIATRSFSGCNALTSINIDEYSNFKSFNNTDIVDTSTNTLIYCNSNVALDSSITSIAEYAYEGSAFTSLAFAKSVTSIGDQAFSNCLMLKTLDLTDYKIPPTITGDPFKNSSLVSISTANETIAQSFKDSWNLPSATDKIVCPSSGEFQILPFANGKLKLTGVSLTTDLAPHEIKLCIKNYADSTPDWSNPITFTGSANESVDIFIDDVVANKPIAFKAYDDNVTFSSINTSVGYRTSNTRWTFSCYDSVDEDVAIPYNVSGKLLSLIRPSYLTDGAAQTIDDGTHFSYLFADGLIDASNLIMADNTTEACYSEMFRTCSSLEIAPILPATSAAYACYSYMFGSCKSLKETPYLPATTINGYSYYYMFSGCSKFNYAHDLPATTLANYCYCAMFYACTSLIKAPSILATTMADHCCFNMFKMCINLKSSCELPATNLATYCYSGMFASCTNLVKGPAKLPATSLVSYCYGEMFKNCTKLSTPPIISASVFSGSCCDSMFYYCDSLYVYADSGTLFFDSTGCTTSNIRTMFTGSGGGFATGTPPTNTKFYYSNNQYLTFIAQQASNISYVVEGNLPNINIQISTDFMNWSEWDGTTISLPKASMIAIRNLSSTLSTSETSYLHFVSSTKFVQIKGCVDSLVNFAPLTDYCFYHLFENSTFLTTTSLVLPSTKLAKYCYCGMFEGMSTSGRTSYELPATTLAEGCYKDMYKGSAVTSTGTMLASSFEPYCCSGMFENCVQLLSTDSTLFNNVESLSDHSCERMFYGCTKFNIYDSDDDNTKTKFFTCPNTFGLVDPVKDMFYGIGDAEGRFSGTPVAGNTYYY